MLRKRITFIIIPPNDGQVQEFRFSSKLLWIAGLVCIVFVGALGYYVSGYHSRSDQYARVDQLQDENDELFEKFQRTKKTLGQLEGQMSVLMGDDEKLRAWHEMPPLSGADRHGGMGGEEDIPEDYFVMPPRKRKLLAGIGSKIVQLQYQAKLQEESFAVIESKFLEKASNLKILPTIAPVYRNQARKTSSFGKRLDPFTGGDAFHNGVDFAGRLGTPVYATADGVVKYSYSEEDIKTRLGNVIAIDHNVTGVDDDGEPFVIPGAYRTEYGHLQKRLVKKGEKVQRGQKIGLMGSTGRSTGPHLHYAVRYQQRRAGSPNKGYVDPEDLFILDWPTKERVPGGWLAGAGD
jgi:murein DD-endopeptidase MepM/ murein hydrolase activator NlpD